MVNRVGLELFYSKIYFRVKIGCGKCSKDSKNKNGNSSK